MSSLWQIIKQQETSSEKPFSSHFDNDNLSLEQLLSDERVIAAFKNQNTQMIKYINQNPQVYRRLVEYITVEPKESDTQDRKHRYPFVAGEMLSVQNSLVYQAFFGIEDNSDGEETPQDNSLLDKLLKCPSLPLNPLLIGYRQKVFNNLYSGNRVKLTSYWLHRHSMQYLKLMSNMNIANTLKKVITLNQEEGEQMFKEQRAGLLKHILEHYTSGDDQYKNNAIDIFRQIFSKHLMISNGKGLLQLILESSPKYLQGNIQEHTLSFIRDLLLKANFKSEEEDNILKLPHDFRANLNNYILEAMKQHSVVPGEKLLNQSRAKVAMLGKPRMFLVETIRQLVKLNTLEQNQTLMTNNLAEWLLDLVSEFKFNSILHCAVQSTLITLLKAKSRDSLVKAHSLITGLCDLLEDPDNNLAFGQLVNIFMVLRSSQDKQIQQLMKQPRVVTVYEDVVLPRKQKNEFKWAGSLTNYKSKPMAFIQEEPGTQVSPVEIQKPKPCADFDFDFKTTMPKSNVFTPFATVTGKQVSASKVSSSDFDFF